MPPKKKEEAPKVTLWGRPSNNLKMGIVGLPNVGKSTTFNCLTKLHVPAENYPFCTIEPNVAKVAVPDERFNELCRIWKPASEVAATLSITDIAGLVPGASKGEGLGNAFLSHIKEVDGIFHVVRAFEDTDIVHTEIDVDPVRDMDIISKELVYKDIEYCEKRMEELSYKISRQIKKEDTDALALFQKAKDYLEKNVWIRNGDFTAREIECLNLHNMITAKKVAYLRKKNKWLPKIAEWVKENIDGTIIPFSAEFEAEKIEKSLNEETKINSEEEKKEGEMPSMIPRIIQTGYNELDLIHFFTAGEDEVRCWTVKKLTKAPKGAGTIHTDFEKGFICAEVMKYTDFVRLGSENAVKNEGKYLQKGKEYEIEDGDIIFFKFNTPFAGKK